MRFRVLLIVVGPFWLVGGLMMAMSPPLEGRRGAASPALGVVIAVSAVVMVALALKQLAAPRDRAPRHSRGERDSRGVRAFGAGGVVAALLGGFCVWSGLNDDSPALVGIGIVMLSASVFAIPLVKDSLGVRKG